MNNFKITKKTINKKNLIIKVHKKNSLIKMLRKGESRRKNKIKE